MKSKLPHPRLVYRNPPEKVNPKQGTVMDHLLKQVERSKNCK